MSRPLPRLALVAALALTLPLQGCLVAAATGAVVGTAGAVISTTAKVGGAVVGAGVHTVTGGGKKKNKDDGN